MHLRRLGFRVELDDSMVQPTDEACGAVSALAAARLSESDWRTADVSLAAHPNIISSAVVSRLDLGLRAGDACPRLSSAQTESLFWFFLAVRTPSRGWDGWNGASFSVLPFDELWTLVEDDSRPMDDADPFVRVCVCNTEVSGMQGSHWFVVAYGID